MSLAVALNLQAVQPEGPIGEIVLPFAKTEFSYITVN